MYNEHHGTIRSQNRIVPRGRPFGGSFENYKEEKQRTNDFSRPEDYKPTRPSFQKEISAK